MVHLVRGRKFAGGRDKVEVLNISSASTGEITGLLRRRATGVASHKGGNVVQKMACVREMQTIEM